MRCSREATRAAEAEGRGAEWARRADQRTCAVRLATAVLRRRAPQPRLLHTRWPRGGWDGTHEQDRASWQRPQAGFRIRYMGHP